MGYSPTNKAFQSDCLTPRFRRQNACMVWGAINSIHKGTLECWDRQANGTIPAQGYVTHFFPSLSRFYHQVRDELHRLYAHTNLSVNLNPLVMQDNAPVHTCSIVRQWFLAHRMVLMEWPLSSPDLNPIENVWAIIKMRLNTRAVRPRTIADMNAAVREEWDAIPHETIRDIINSMPGRVQALIDAQGRHIRY